ncbi:MAG: twin-arginine translocase subunit TatC [Chloroflexi bacterium]|nr:twin-arginine translocase subunit TatC [Chloroflexota bacterium]
MSEHRRLTILEHLQELRSRLLISLAALAMTTALSLAFAKPLMLLLVAPIGEGRLVALSPTETIIAFFRVSLISGVVLAMPVIVYQLVRFLLPALTDQERRYLMIFVPAAWVSFALGVGFAALVILPFAVRYLQGFLSDVIAQTWAVSPYLSFVTTFLLAMGLVFETPLAIFFLAKLGIVSPAFLRHYRRHAVVLIATASSPVCLRAFFAPGAGTHPR